MTRRPAWLTEHMGNRIYNLLVADGHVREADAFRLAWDAAADTEKNLLAARMRAEKVYNGTDPYPMRGDGYIAMTLIDAVLAGTKENA